ncbi:hypothetical protein [Hymenobacter chitinivorans]|uniref:Uncharacterized protein n=1 Tax=Hymenobacter chitinivorans DSM 11115 TaxID=1121954 RepID=A0A2M9BS92_9BACT|nr:hypothetical protein [Hymenobacter chitinivorans]PJJ60824.1 hypothetical protein CLV45_2257 [Hymenobacter chitinivorans DSM 11115]
MNFQFTTAALPSCVGHVSFLDLNPAARRRQPAADRRAAPFFDRADVVETCGPGANTLRFVLRQAANGASFLHLALFCRERQLAHWILPASSLPQPDLTPPAYLVETASTLPQPARVIDEGTCLLRHCAADQGTYLEQDLRAGSLQLTFAGRTLRGSFCLERLHPGSQTWELGRVRPLPPRSARALA